MSRLPTLGRRGEGWFALQLAFLAVIAASGLFLGGAWRGAAGVLTTIAGAALAFGGLGLTALGVRDLGRSLSPLPRPVPDGDLVEHGVYRRIRHPIYAGVVLAAIGWSLLTASPAALLVCAGLAALLDLKARREEAWLRIRYAGFDDYARRTRRFVPGLY